MSNEEKEKSETNSRRRITLGNYESAIEKQIREAMERGDFENLRGQGKPLNLARDPNVPQDWELAFKVLKDAGYAPDWIEMAQEIRAARAKLFQPLERALVDPPNSREERATSQNNILVEFRARAAELNRLIDTYNLKAPNAQVHLRRIRIEHEIEEFLRKFHRVGTGD